MFDSVSESSQSTDTAAIPVQVMLSETIAMT